MGNPQVIGLLEANRGFLAAEQGRWAESAGHFQAAALAHEEGGQAHDIVVALTGLGRAVHRLGRRDEAARHLRAAEALAAGIANPQRLADVRAALAETGESADAAALPDGLTVRQVDVLRLLADGLSNKQIAAELCLSPATIERHLATVYRKLGHRRPGRGDPLRRHATGWPPRCADTRPGEGGQCYNGRGRAAAARPASRGRQRVDLLPSAPRLTRPIHGFQDSRARVGGVDISSHHPRWAYRLGRRGQAAESPAGAAMQEQVHGTTMPVLSIHLDPGESVVAEVGEFSWMTDSIQMSTGMAAGAGGRGRWVRSSAGGARRCSRAPTRRRAGRGPSRSRRRCPAASCRSMWARERSTWCTGTVSWPARPASRSRPASSSRSARGSSLKRVLSCTASAARAGPGPSCPAR